MTKNEKTCYNCGNKNCNVFYSKVKKDYKRHFEIYEYNNFSCVNHDRWEELKVEEIRTDNTETLENALERIAELEKENTELKERIKWYSEQICNKECAEVWGELTKAKEIIKDLLDTQYRLDPYLEVFKVRIKRAEDFIICVNHVLKKKQQNI